MTITLYRLCTEEYILRRTFPPLTILAVSNDGVLSMTTTADRVWVLLLAVLFT